MIEPSVSIPGSSAGASHVFHKIYLHVTWHCKDNLPLITPALEPRVFALITDYFRKTKGVHLIAINGTPTHVHVAMQVEPFVTLGEFVGQVKGATSREINKGARRQALVWQRGYGVVSFSESQLGTITTYIEKQKEHHRSGVGLHPTLENSGKSIS